ncbi:MAG: hypothetical protein CMJ78_05665 [Planctomycetaceae bacterium]|nr:hypothetical protein [Planctomycetaceae bacterium]
MAASKSRLGENAENTEQEFHRLSPSSIRPQIDQCKLELFIKHRDFEYFRESQVARTTKKRPLRRPYRDGGRKGENYIMQSAIASSLDHHFR